MLKILKQNGFEIISQNGSHIKLYHTGDIKIGTYKSILKQAGLK